MELDAKTQLRRFCYLGSLEPVYVHLRVGVNVHDYWPKITVICAALDDTAFVLILRDVLQQTTLVRRDEPLFAYAAYLSSPADVKWKTAVRNAFPALVHTDDDLFLFCKYAVLIQREQQRKGFTQTTRKAITAWYEHQSPEALRNMWLEHRGAHGFTHKALIKMCHVNDETIGAVGVVSAFFKTCTELLKQSEQSVSNNIGDEATNVLLAPVATESATVSATESATAAPESDTATPESAMAATESTMAATESATEAPESDTATPESATVSAPAKSEFGTVSAPTAVQAQESATVSAPTTAQAPENTRSNVEITNSSVLSMSKLRTTKNKSEALRIVRKFKLHYNQVPSHLLRYAPIMEALIPSMSYLQLLKCWRNLARYNHFENPRLLKLCQTLLGNKKLLRKDNIHPVVLLLQMDQLGIRDDLSKLAPKKVQAMRMSYFKELYALSFGHNQSSGLRMHITINLQNNYKKKLLNNHKKLCFIDGAVALAFGYYKRESVVHTFHWAEDQMKLQQIAWTKEMGIVQARGVCEQIQNAKNSQRLVAPLMQALDSKLIYDVFVVIVPSAGRGNPKQNSEFLCKFLDRYRETYNSRSKFVIVNLRKFKRSMAYSQMRNENILEICGLDEHTPALINNFALNRFG